VAAARRFELDDLLIRPGTYFNPQTEILVVVDDSPELDQEIFDAKEIEGPEWVLISDETPIDESLRDEVLERFQSAHQSGRALGEHEDEEDEDEEDDELEPDDEEVELD
jgi:hypothetical protein